MSDDPPDKGSAGPPFGMWALAQLLAEQRVAGAGSGSGKHDRAFTRILKRADEYQRVGAGGGTEEYALVAALIDELAIISLRTDALDEDVRKIESRTEALEDVHARHRAVAERDAWIGMKESDAEAAPAAAAAAAAAATPTVLDALQVLLELTTEAEEKWREILKKAYAASWGGDWHTNCVERHKLLQHTKAWIERVIAQWHAAHRAGA